MSNPAKAVETITTWIEWLKAERRTNGNVGVVGWSFGAGWALEASINTPVEATVIYVGLIYPEPTRLALMKGPVMVHLAERDYDVSKNDLVPTAFLGKMECFLSFSVHGNVHKVCEQRYDAEENGCPQRVTVIPEIFCNERFGIEAEECAQTTQCESNAERECKFLAFEPP